MAAESPLRSKSFASRKERSQEVRNHAPARPIVLLNDVPIIIAPVPAAGAHAAPHLINEDSTPGAGVLPSHSHRFGKEVDGAAG